MFALKLYTLFLCFVAVSVTSALDLGHATSSGAEIDGRITGGDLAHENQFPYQAGLSIEFSAGQFIWCGGSLISEHWILTAAHCVEEIRLITIYMGSVKRLEPMIIVKLTSENVYLHNAWHNKTLVNDIALLYLPTPVPFNAGIHPVALPHMIATMHVSYAYHEAIATGWGRMSDASPAISNDLRYVVRYVQSNDECQHAYGASVKSTNICIDTTGGKSTCTGDSGGPLVVYDDDINDVVLIGLTSFGKTSGCTKGMPAVFTRITSYLYWIQEISGIAYY